MLSWQPGFDGGLPQRFQVRYGEVGGEGMKYEDVVPRTASKYTVKGALQSGQWVDRFTDVTRKDVSPERCCLDDGLVCRGGVGDQPGGRVLGCIENTDVVDM